jgi:hypothetical protein
MPDDVFHTILITSEWLVFHETTAGPFDPSRTVFAAWAPDGSDAVTAADYMARLASDVNRFVRTG